MLLQKKKKYFVITFIYNQFFVGDLKITNNSLAKDLDFYG